MPLFDSLIVAACVSVQPTYLDMCQKTVDASARQVGIRQEVDRAETLTTKYAEAKIRNSLTPAELKITEAGLVGYKVVRDKRIRFRLPTLGLASTVNNEISLDTYFLTMNWSF